MAATNVKKMSSPRRIATIVAATLLGAWLFFAYLFEPLLPFLLAALLAAALQKPLALLDKKTGRKRHGRRVLSIFLVLTTFGVLVLICAFFIGRLFSEGRSLVSSLADNAAAIAAALEDTLDRFSAFLSSLPILRDGRLSDSEMWQTFTESLDTMLIDLLQSAVASLSSRIPSLLAAIAAAMPRILLFLSVWFMATLYLVPAWHDIGVFVTKHFPEKASLLLRGVRSSLFSTLFSYAKAYSILIAITFCELLVGFWVLKISYAIGLAAVIAIIDILPVLGVGTVLLPWALVMLIWGDTGLGVGLLVLYGVISLVRSFLEGRILGAQIGLHPLLALFSLYVGARLFGVAGLFLAPIACAVTLQYVTRARKEKMAETAEKKTPAAPRHAAVGV